MSWELINRITVKPDGVYLSSHSSNDTSPFHSWRCGSLSDIYATEGQLGLDREIIGMLYEYAQLRGSHKSVERYRNLLDSPQAKLVRSRCLEMINARWESLTAAEQRSVHLFEQTEAGQSYRAFERATRIQLYTDLAVLLNPAA